MLFKKLEMNQNVIQKKTCVDKSSEFYNRSIKFWLKDNGIEIYSTHNEGKPVVTKRFIKALKNKIYKHMI